MYFTLASSGAGQSTCSTAWSTVLATRPALSDVLQSVEELAPIDQHLEKEHQEKTKVKNIQVNKSAKLRGLSSGHESAI